MLTVVKSGPESIVVSGPVVSGSGSTTVHVKVAGVGSMLPWTSMPRTSNVCAPDVEGWVRRRRRARARGAAPSSEHSNARLGPGVELSEPRKREGCRRLSTSDRSARRDRRAGRRRVGAGRSGDDRPGVAGRREIDVVERVDGAHLEGVRHPPAGSCTSAGFRTRASSPTSGGSIGSGGSPGSGGSGGSAGGSGGASSRHSNRRAVAGATLSVPVNVNVWRIERAGVVGGGRENLRVRSGEVRSITGGVRARGADHADALLRLPVAAGSVATAVDHELAGGDAEASVVVGGVGGDLVARRRRRRCRRRGCRWRCCRR